MFDAYNFALNSRAACSLNAFFKILPLAFFGIESMNLTPPSNLLYLANHSSVCAITCSSVSLTPALGMIYTRGNSEPLEESFMSMTAASVMSG